ncbi:MAG: HYR domain-containing protein [Bacteroidota bacterium]
MIVLSLDQVNGQCLSFGTNGPYNFDDPLDTLVTEPAVSDANITNEEFSGTGITNDSVGIFDPGTAGPGVWPITLIASDSGSGCDTMPTLTTNLTVCNLMAICIPDTSIEINSGCEIDITTAFIDDGSSDSQCGIASITVSPTSLDDGDVGDNIITMIVTNSVGLSDTCTTTITLSSADCPDDDDFTLTIDGVESPVQDPDTICSTAGILPLAVTVSDNFGNPLCIGAGTWSADNSEGVVDSMNNNGSFDPELAGEGLHIISFDYNCPATGEDIGFSMTVFVTITPTAVLVADTTLSCADASGNLFLSSFFESSSSQSGTWLFLDGPSGSTDDIDDATFSYTAGGCYSFSFTADDPFNCLTEPAIDTVDVHLQTKPDFTVTLDSEGGCIPDGETITVSASVSPDLASDETMSGFIILDGATIAWDPTDSYDIPSPDSGETSDVEFYVIRDKTGSVSCGDNGPCPDTVSVEIFVYNDGLNCQSNCEMNEIDVCDISVDPQLTLSCSFFSLSIPFDIVGANISPSSDLIDCDQDSLYIDYNTEFAGFNPESGGGGTLVKDLPGLEIICDVFDFCICIDLGAFGDIKIRPFEELYDALQCDDSLAEVVLTLLGDLLGGDGGGATVVADTDGDGAFDYEVDSGTLLDASNVGIPVRVIGQGELTVRMVYAWPNMPAGVCGDATTEGQDLLTLLPIGSIPLVGPQIVAALEAASCNVDLSWSNEETIVYPVINGNPPEFVNCPSDGFTFTQDFTCSTTANWSIPIAIDGCTGEPIIYQADGTVPDEGAVIQLSGPSPGDDLDIGVYTAVYQAIACNSMTALCSIPIIIDTGNPDLIVPNDLTVCNDIDACSAIVTGIAPRRGIGCNTEITFYTTGATTIGSAAAPEDGEASGRTYEVGTTTITYIMTWTDAFGVTMTEMDSFDITVEDCQAPIAECITITAQLGNDGTVSVTADDIDGLSSDNCTDNADLTFNISKDMGTAGSEVSFDCSELGTNFVTLSVTDEAGNESFCLATVEVIDYFEDFTLALDLPELCLEANNPEQLDFSNYLNITLPNGTVIGAGDVSGVLGGSVIGVFGITSFIPSAGTSGVDIGTSAADPQDIGYIDPVSGVYTPGSGSGFVTITYVMTIGGQDVNGNNALEGCFILVHETFELKQPLTMEDPMCDCLGVNERHVDLGVVSGGLEPYRLVFAGGVLDYDRDGVAEDTSGIYTYDAANGFDISDNMQDLGILQMNFTSPVWTISVIDARGCEIARSGSCDIIDATVGPEIDCTGANDFDTEVFICERQYSWQHAIPTDNCAVTQYSYSITNPDGTISGPFSLDALIDDLNPGIPLEELLEGNYLFQAGTSEVVYYAEDAVGNFATCSFNVNVEDNDPPYFINCPYPDVIVATETGQCDAFVNFALPFAEDNCVIPTVTQIDDTGLKTGDRFPIGTTILTFQATDEVGNKAICNVKVIVNYFDQIPNITCPQDVNQLNDDWLCGATVNNIDAEIDELCSDALVKTYQITQNGSVIGSGVGDASGTFFDVGVSEVTYRVQNQPLLLISEVSQNADAVDGGMNPPPIENEFQCFSNPLFTLGNGDSGEGLVYYPEDDILYHFSGSTAGNQYFEQIYFPGKCVQPNHAEGNTYGPDIAGEVTGMVWDTSAMKFIAMDDGGTIFTVSTTGDFLVLSTYDQTFPLAGFAMVGSSVYGVDPNSTNLYEFDPVTGMTIGTAINLTSSGEAITNAIDIASDPNSGVVYIVYSTAASSTAYIGTLDVTTGMITEQGDTFIDFAGIAVNADGLVYGVSTKASGSDLFTIKCAIPGDDYIEIANIGPSIYDISCLTIERILPSSDVESFTVPQDVILAPGEVLVLHYGTGVDDLNGPSYFLNYCDGTDQPANAEIEYSIYFGNNRIDGITMFDDADAGIIRSDVFDTDTPADFVLAEDCLSLTLGEYNPNFPASLSNGTSTSLQSEPMSIAECSFSITISDAEPPKCMEIDSMNINTYMGSAFTAVEGQCDISTITVANGNDCILADINISVAGNIVGAEHIALGLISPDNDTLDLYDELCIGDASVDLTFDDESDNSASQICGSWTGDFRPQNGMLMKFYTAKADGDWSLYVNIEDGSGASFDITSWSIDITCLQDWEMENVVLDNDTMVCNAIYTWTHPYFADNCREGTIRVDYLTDDDIPVPPGSILLENIGKGGFEVTETFGVGVTTVQYTLIDAAGNQSLCSFTVTVLDDEPPVITSCPNDIIVGLESGQCEARVFYDVEATDNCGVASIVGVPPSGSYFPIGTTPVIVTVTDLSGNISICEFNIIVIEFQPSSNQLSCNNGINLSLDQNCEAVINADQILEGSEYGCFDDYCITVETETGIPHPNFFTVNDINQTFIVTVIDCNGDSTNSCWGAVTIEEKFTPELQCPVDVTIACNQDPDARNMFGILLTGEAFLLNCEPGAEIYYEDNEVDFGQCADPRMEILRTWIVTDSDGNQDACTQVITVEAVDLNDIVFPPDVDLDMSLECLDVQLDPSLTDPDSTGLPTINGHLVSTSGSLCMISMNVSDEIFDICPGSYEILRTWKIRNMCLPISDSNPIEHTQIIKVLDTKPPKMIDCPTDMLMSVDPWGCQASGQLPVPETIYDQCSDVEFSAAIFGGGQLEITGTPQNGDLAVVALNLRIGPHTVVYRVKDDCGNVQVCAFDINVVDNTPPTAIALQNIVISLTSSSTSGDGSAKLYALDVDNGSFDGCSNSVKLEIRRETDLCDISGNTTYNDDDHPQDGSPNPNSPNYDPDGGEYVKFCCEDLNNLDLDVDGDGVNDIGYVKVWLRVWDDGNRDGIFGNDGDQYNEAWVYVKVEDKLAPVVICPPDVTISCADDVDDLNLVGEAEGFNSCGNALVEYNDIIVNLNSCNAGFVVRRWRVVGQSDIFCDQRITLEDIDAPVTVSFAQVGDVEVDGCPDQITLGEPTWIGGPCDIIEYTVNTDTFLFEDGACYKLINEYRVINWCDYDPNNPFWVETDDFTDGIIRHIQVVKVTDNTQPVLADCDDRMFEVNDHSDSDNDGIVCEANIVLTNSATDPGSNNCPTGWLKWQVFVDLWADGTNDLEFSSFLPPFDNTFNDTNGNGIPDRYVSPTENGGEIAIELPDIEGSMSNHKVVWKVTDGCNNIRSCDYDFMVVDKKAPTPYCIDISTAVMDFDGTTMIWASDLNIGSFDNCSAEEDLRFTFSDVPPEDDPAYDPVLRSSSRVLDCGDVINSPIAVNMYIWDEKINYAFCQVDITVVDNSGVCDEGVRIAGQVETETGEAVQDVDVTLNADLLEYPRLLPTDDEGQYSFLGNPLNANYELTGKKDVDYLNGVNTLDLVIIQRHILELQQLDSPYKVIAADINGDQEVKVTDILELRKLILGIYVELPENESWRFVDKYQEFDDIYAPWPIIEDLELPFVQNDLLENDFIAIKVGDVTNDAVTNFNAAKKTTTRSLPTIDFTYEDRSVKAGELVEVTVRSGEAFDLLGYQLSMELNGLAFESITGGALTIGKENLGLLRTDLITMSYHQLRAIRLAKDAELFTLNFIAEQSGILSKMIDFTSELTANEAYLSSADLEKISAPIVHEVVLRPENDLNVEFANVLYQNEPNPFNKVTVIGFDLAEKSDVSLTIFDATGSAVATFQMDGEKGYNSFELEADLIGENGIYFYKLEAGEFVDTRKMILVQ